MERVVKGFTGYSKEKEGGKPATHVILTVDEYRGLLNDIRNAEAETRRTVQKANSEVTSYKKEAKNIIEQERSNAKKRIEAIQSDLNKANDEIHRLDDLNSNIKRIMRERANAKRRIKPKKEHHGYIIIDSHQDKYVFRYYVQGSLRSEEYQCWKVRIQTPYDCSIPYKTVAKEIFNDLKELGIYKKLGLQCTLNVELIKTNEKFKEEWEKYNNLIFKTSYKANVKTGFWEIEYSVKFSIIVPEDMRGL